MRSRPTALAIALASLAWPAGASAARTLYIPASTAGKVAFYSIGPGSSLTPVAGSPVNAAGPEAAVATPDGKFLFVTENSNDDVLRFSVAGDGSLTSLGAP